jgi:hypothetical protein
MQRLGRIVGNVLAVMLAVFSLQAMAEAQLAGRDFNHAATGFPLTGLHATAACETCHVAGVFKGTAKTCDGCHALGKRVVATPMPTTHIVTDAPCDSCHFNASTFLGARFNHGTALPGQCRNCHNGRQSMGKPASHATGNKATKSCDQCHRSFTWFQASWNHVGVVPGSCATPGNGCHVQGENQYYRSTSTHVLTYMRTNNCDDCHNFVSWTPRHMPPTQLCKDCHNNTDAKGTSAYTGHTAITASQNCTDCHSTTTIYSASWAGALGAKPSNHIPYIAAAQCINCHPTPSTWLTGATLHAYVSATCKDCHNSSPVYLGNMQRVTLGSHHSSSASQDCISCHTKSYTRWGGAG